MKLIYELPTDMTIDQVIQLAREIENEIGMVPVEIEVNGKRQSFAELRESPE